MISELVRTKIPETGEGSWRLEKDPGARIRILESGEGSQSQEKDPRLSKRIPDS